MLAQDTPSPTWDFENSAIESLSQSVELPILLTVAPYSLHPASSKVEAKLLLSQSLLSLSQEPTLHAPNSVFICHCPRINFCCTIFVNYVRVSAILSPSSFKIIPKLIVKISKSHVSIIPMENLWEFWVIFCWIWCRIDKNGSNIFNNHFILKSYERWIEWTSHRGTIF